MALSVEIGFGMGDTLLQMATDEPTKNFVGIEVHRPGIGKLLHHIAENDLKNLWIICQDAKEAMMNCFESNSIDKIFILFPDPWPKKRHQKRRLIQSNFVALLTEKLKPGGILHLATDWKPYAEQMLEILEQSKGLVNENGSSNYWNAQSVRKQNSSGAENGWAMMCGIYYSASLLLRTRSGARAP